MLPYSFRPGRIILVVFFLFALGYGIFEAQGIVLGPQIHIDDASVESSTQFVRIQGVATHIASLSMNGAAIPVTTDGAFDEPFLLASGENRVVLSAKDKYGHTTQKLLVLYYHATSSPATSTPAESAPAASTTPSDSSSTPDTR
jgi:hypothetical protein